MVNYIYLIPAFPLLAFVLNILFGKRLKSKSALFSISAVALSLLFSCIALKDVIAGNSLHQSFTWFNAGKYSFKLGLLVDSLGALMLVVVTAVSFLVQVYSVGYMHHDLPYGRFFAYLSLFTFSMLGLVLSDNLIQIYIFWELVGLCSYLLISYWFKKPEAAEAGKKAFITTRIGDAGFFVGIATLFYYLGTADFLEINQKIAGGTLSQGVLTISAILIFCGAIGKSAQFPLHVWLPDAMEGPTPVSALIHAATMVAAGVYLVARTYAIFEAGHLALQVVSYIGIITAVMSATIALVQNDIKRILAYSTISQLGYMMVALGVGGYTAGVFHLMTHAFFKAMLFLCAGSVIHATGIQDIREMGGLFKKIRITAITCLIGALAISGVPPLSGFWSKDEILSSIYASGNKVIFVLALLTAFMTSFYMFRLLFLTFFGKARNEKIHAHESPAVMTVPLIILSILSIFSGFVGSPFMNHYFSHFIYFTHHEPEANLFVMYSSIFVALLGISLAWVFYILNPKIPSMLARNFSPVYNLLLNKYWIDEIYDRFIIQPFFRLTQLAFSFDTRIIDGTVNLCARVSVAISEIKGWFDRYIIDGFVNLLAISIKVLSLIFRRLQTGYIQNYILLIFTGIAVVVILLKFI